MPRLIDADDLLMDNSWAFYDENGNRNDACIAVENAPTVEAEPVKHGEWKPQITALGTMIFRCSACQKFSDIHWAYCPQCGAKMDGERRKDVSN